MFSRSKEDNNYYSPDDEVRAAVEWLETGKTPPKVLGTVIWDSLREREFKASTPEKIAQHNARVLAQQSPEVVFKAPRTVFRGLRQALVQRL